MITLKSFRITIITFVSHNYIFNFFLFPRIRRAGKSLYSKNIINKLSGQFPYKVAHHESCHTLRELGISAEISEILNTLDGIDIINQLIDEIGEFQIPLEMIRLAPSASNFQPWRVLMVPKENIFHFYIHRRKPRSRTLISWPDFARIDLGIAVSHFDLTVKQANLNGDWVIENFDTPHAENMEYLISWVSK